MVLVLDPFRGFLQQHGGESIDLLVKPADWHVGDIALVRFFRCKLRVRAIMMGLLWNFL